MTMINPCENLSKQNLIRSSTSVYGFGFGDFESNFSLMSQLVAEEEGYDDEYYRQPADNSCLGGSDLALIEVMAEDESRTGSINETGSSSKDNNDTNNNNIIREEEEKGWLQLSIGMPTNNKPPPSEGGGRSSGGRLVELDLLATVSSEQGRSILANSPTVHMHEFRAPPPRRQQLMTTTATAASTTSTLFLQQHPGSTAGTSSTTMFPQQQHHQEIINWGFRPMQAPIIQQNMNLSLVSGGSYFGPGPFPVLGGPGPSSVDFRVVHPPRRPHSGLWFSLQSSSNQTKEPFLPQISKSYLRIKDGRMTIRLVLKYLVNKLQLENESEIEITCRGQQLQPFLTLQHVRDHIWSTTTTTNAADNIIPLLPSETSNHVMVLHYGRRSAAQN